MIKALPSVVIFIAVFFSSMLGAQIMGISLNKIALIPLECYLLIKMMQNGRTVRLTKEKRNLLVWYGVLIFSSVLNLIKIDQLAGAEEKLVFNVIQYLFFYIPILLMINEIDDAFSKFKNAMILVAKINCICAITQFICWSVFSFDFNQFLFSTILRGVLGNEWTAWSYETGSLAIRATGLNYDPAYLAVILVLGFVLCENPFWKMMFFLGCVCAMSRVGITSILFVVIIQKVRELIRKGGAIGLKTVIKPVIFLASAVGVILFLYTAFDVVQYQIDYVLSRFSFVSQGSAGGSGTMRHIMYVPLAIVELLNLPFIYQLFGVGPRIGGSAITFSDSAQSVIALNSQMQATAWAIECDFAELLLGSGLLGFGAYYFILYTMLKDKRLDVKNVGIGLFIFGFMYCVSLNTLINILFIFVQSGKGKQFLNEKNVKGNRCIV